MSAAHMMGEAHKVAELQKLLVKNDHHAVLRKGKAALKKWPKSIAINQFLGRSAISLKQMDKGIYHLKRASKLEGGTGKATFDLGVALVSAKQFEPAYDALVARMQAAPDDAACADALGFTCFSLAELSKALYFHNLACKLDPTNAQYSIHRAYTLERTGLIKQLIKAYQIVQQIDPDSYIASQGLAKAYKLNGKVDLALAELERCQAKWPEKAAEIHMDRGRIHLITGDVEKVREEFEKALEIKPEDAELWYSYVVALGDQSPDTAEQVRNLAKRAKGRDRVPVFAALARAEKNQKNYKASHDAYVEFNRLVREENQYSIETDRKNFAMLKKICAAVPETPEILKTEASCPDPIFIVGMPRSGTSLMETIFARHSHVTPLGESEVMSKIVTSNVMFSEPLEKVQGLYLERAAAEVETPRITDKNPLNFRYLGAMDRIFPKAKFIRMNRDPRAVAWSMYTTRMITPSYTFCYDPEELIAYFDLYHDMMDHWEKQLPEGRILHVNYEDLTAAPDDQIPAILKAVGLPFEEACLSPEKSTHSVNTASNMQVRRPIYKGSSEAWRKYEPWAGHWLSRLAPKD